MILATGQIVLLTDEPILFENVKLLPGRELFATDETSEAFYVEHFIAGSTYQIGGQNALRAARTFCAKAPVQTQNRISDRKVRGL